MPWVYKTSEMCGKGRTERTTIIPSVVYIIVPCLYALVLTLLIMYTEVATPTGLIPWRCIECSKVSQHVWASTNGVFPHMYMWHKEINCNQRASHHIHTASYMHAPHCLVMHSHQLSIHCCPLPYQVILSIFPLAPSTEIYYTERFRRSVQKHWWSMHKAHLLFCSQI